MIHNTIKILAEQLDEHITRIKKPGDGIVSPHVIPENISTMDAVTLLGKNKILLSLVNISEEKTIRPATPGRPVNLPVHKHPNLNLYLLFTVCMNNYELSLSYLSWVIEYFHGKNVFELQISNHEEENADNFRIILEMLSLSLEQTTNLWGSLGGEQHPFVCYKTRIIS